MEIGKKKVVNLNPDIFIVILNINGFNIPIKRCISQPYKNGFYAT